MRRRTVVFITLGIVVGVLGLVATALFLLNFIDIDLRLSGPVSISTQWLEISPSISMRPWKQNQYVSLDIDGVNTNHLPLTEAFKSGKLQLADGTAVTPEVELIDENGRVYSLHVSMIDNKGIGYGKDCDPECGFPWTKYRTVRIRADRVIHCSRVTWHCHTGK